MDSISDVIASLIDSAKERLGNPLVGAFILSWLIWNFRLVLVLIGDGDGGWLAKIDFIDKRLMSNHFDWQIHGFLLPLMFACLWVFAFPFVARKIAVFHKTQMLATKRAILLAEQNKPITEEEAMRLRLRMKGLNDKWVEDRKVYLLTIEDLQDRLADKPTLQVDHPRPNSINPISPSYEGEDGSFQPPSEYDFSDIKSELERRPVGSKALAGLVFSGPVDIDPETSEFFISFNGNLIEWPWRFVAAAQPDLPTVFTKSLKAVSFDEQMLMVLYLVRNSEKFNAEPLMDILTIEAFRVKATLSQLANLQLLEGPFGSNQYSISAHGRIFLTWLLSQGIVFTIPYSERELVFKLGK